MRTGKIKLLAVIALIILIIIASFTNCIYASTDKTITELGKDWIDKSDYYGGEVAGIFGQKPQEQNSEHKFGSFKFRHK